MVRKRKDGLGNAYRAGFREGLDRGYDLLLQMDADLSHDPAAIPALLSAIDEGAEAAIGSRYVPGGEIPHWPWHRRALSKWGNRYACVVLGMDVHDATSGYRAYRAEALDAIDVFSTRSQGYGIQIETAYRISQQGRKLAEVPIVFTDRVRGHSKMSFSVMIEELALVTWWGVRDRARRLLSGRRARRRATG
jgi:glycosyltransferase involved in cell wall biosynthesis